MTTHLEPINVTTPAAPGTWRNWRTWALCALARLPGPERKDVNAASVCVDTFRQVGGNPAWCGEIFLRYLLVCKNSDTIIFNITWEDLAATLSPLPRKLHMMGAKDRGARWRDDSDLYGEVLSADLEAVEVVGSSGGLSLHDKQTIGGKGVRRQRVKRETAMKRQESGAHHLSDNLELSARIVLEEITTCQSLTNPLRNSPREADRQIDIHSRVCALISSSNTVNVLCHD